MKKVFALCLAVTLLLTIPCGASAETGIGLSTPPANSLVIDTFPYHYSDTLRVYNTGDEEGIFTMSAVADYPDVEKWVTFDKTTFTLKPDENTPVRFDIDVKESYIGDYPLVIQASILPQGTDIDGSSGINAVAYLSLSRTYTLDIEVPAHYDSDGGLPPGILGERPVVTPEPTPDTEIQEIAEEVAESEGGVVSNYIGQPISLDIPSEVELNKEVNLCASFIGGGEPVDMGLTLVSPSGKEYHLSRTTTFTFDEVGTWSAMVVISGDVILGKPIHVVKGSGPAVPIPPYVAVLALIIVMVCIGRRKDE